MMVTQRKLGGPRHNMVVVGESGVYLSYLPIFHSPHDLQLIMEATFQTGKTDLRATYTKERQGHRDNKLYTLAPEAFDVKTLFACAEDRPSRHSFRATLFRGHLERGGRPLASFTDVEVSVSRVIYAGQLGPALKTPAHLEYILFGSGTEFFVAHVITFPMDFEQIISVKLDNSPGAGELNFGTRVTIADRKNSPSQRIKEGEQLSAQAQGTGERPAL